MTDPGILIDSRCPCPACTEARNSAIRELIAERDVLRADVARERITGQGLFAEVVKLRAEAGRRSREIVQLAEDYPEPPVGVDILYTRAGYPRSVEFFYP